MAIPLSILDPNAPRFIPAAFLAAEDFSPEWWLLVHTCPAFREFWIRERFDCSDGEELTAQDVSELEDLDDFMELQLQLEEMERAEEAFQFLFEDSHLSPSGIN